MVVWPYGWGVTAGPRDLVQSSIGNAAGALAAKAEE
jgi:hypothetical protein